jgi:hypothetical protein
MPPVPLPSTPRIEIELTFQRSVRFPDVIRRKSLGPT